MDVPATPCSKMEAMREKWQELVEATSHDIDSICITWACKISTYLSNNATAPRRLEVATKSIKKKYVKTSCVKHLHLFPYLVSQSFSYTRQI